MRPMVLLAMVVKIGLELLLHSPVQNGAANKTPLTRLRT